jgi:hydrogenase maturation protein HypF
VAGGADPADEPAGSASDAVDEPAGSASDAVDEPAGSASDAVDEPAGSASDAVDEPAGSASDAAGESWSIRVRGTVQGVGFRPFVYRHAVALGLLGTVRNDSAGVLIEVQGAPGALSELRRRLSSQPPPLARVTSVEVELQRPTVPARSFRIVDSVEVGSPAVAVSVDTATCAECLAEVDDPADRRFGYPFTNCTNCGPRYTIVLSVPYDRPATTMATFVMCPACQAEYDDPADRRFHAQPNACPVCGPRLSYLDPSGTPVAGDALSLAIEALADGRILAVKGIGGYHLATDATNRSSVAELRRRKHRDDKPFAVMVADVAAARQLCRLTPGAEAALSSPRRPIVLAPAVSPSPLAPSVAPGLAELGVMLVYSPLHHLLLAGADRPLVMTSGNLSDDPIAHHDDDAVRRLGSLVDGLLTHDRPIHIRCDDSVLRSTDRGLAVVRRSRGYAPEPLSLPGEARRQVLAVGAELKNTVSVAKATMVVPSHHIGDLEHLATYESFLQATGHMCRLYGVVPEVVAHDLHPEYLSTKYALDLDLDPWPVQHHHAHIASCLVEHGHTDKVLGIAFDGFGMGPDGTMWGGEMLVADLSGFERVGHLRSVRVPGGSAAVREPWRMALAWVHAGLGADVAAELGPDLDPRWEAVLGIVEAGQGMATTSAGRLFDTASALLGVRRRVTYEGQAAIELEALARRVPRSAAPRYPVEVAGSGSEMAVLDPAPLLGALLDDMRRGVEPAVVAAGFHEGLGRGAATLAATLAGARGLDTVALSGGVFQNARLSAIVEDGLVEAGLKVLVQRLVPPNDGGISVGQAAIAALS